MDFDVSIKVLIQIGLLFNDEKCQSLTFCTQGDLILALKVYFVKRH